MVIHKNHQDITDALCSLLNIQTNTVIFLNYNDFSQIEALNSQLFLKLASKTNIPIMTYIPNAYATVKLFFFNG
jgi:hypothetical protein